MKKETIQYFVLVFLSASFIATASAEEKTSTADTQKKISITVYNSNLALVRDVRQVELEKGGELHFMDVAASIMPATVHVKSLEAGDTFKILEQNYEYDLMSQEKVLDKYVGQKIKIINWNEYQDRATTVEATLLSNEGQIYRVNDEIYLGYPGYKVVPEIPNNLISKPTLTWIYENEGALSQQIEVSYLTSNIGWQADYVLVLEADEKLADLSGWVTLDNRSGAIYKDAALKLVAGDVHRVEAAQQPMYEMKARTMFAQASASDFSEKSFFEYHLYDLGRNTTIKNNETKQIRLLQASDLQFTKEYAVRGSNPGYFMQRWADANPRQPVNVSIKFKNTTANNLGMPLPAGIMRLYKKDTDGSEQFIGEDRIEHMPTDEEVRLKIGEAFDVAAERVQTDYSQVTTRAHESEWEITLKNRKDEDITVTIFETLSGDWKILSQSHPFVKKDAFTASFQVELPKKSETKVRYRVRVEF